MNLRFAPLLALLAGFTSLGAAEAKIEETARRLFKSHADAIVTVRATVALTMTAVTRLRNPATRASRSSAPSSATRVW